MASITEVMLLINGDAMPAVKAIREVSTKLGEVQTKAGEAHKSFLSIFTPLAAGAAALGGITAFVGILAKGVDAAKEDQKALAGLNQALANTKQSIPQDALDKATGSMNKFGHNSAETYAALQMLVQAGVPVNKALDSMGTLADLSATKNISLADSAHIMILAAQGQGRALKDLNVTLPPTIANAKTLANEQAALAKTQKAYTDAVAAHGETSKQATDAQTKLAAAQQKVDDTLFAQTHHMENYGAVVGSVANTVGGQATANANTFDGALKAMGSTITDKVLVPLGTWLMPKLTEFSKWITDHADQIQSFIHTVLEVMGTAFHVIGVAVGFLSDNSAIFLPILRDLVIAWAAWKAVMFARGIIDGIASAVSGLSGALGPVGGGVGKAEQEAAAGTEAMGAAAGRNRLLVVGLSLAILDVARNLAQINWDKISPPGSTGTAADVRKAGNTFHLGSWYPFGGGASGTDIGEGEFKWVGEGGSYKELFQAGRSGRVITHADSMALARQAGTEGGSSGGDSTSIGAIHVYNPASELDIVRSLESARWLAVMSKRGAGVTAFPQGAGA